MVKNYPFELDFVELMLEWVNGCEDKVLKELNLYHRGRSEVKAFTDTGIMVTVASILGVENLKAKVYDLVKKMVSKAIESVEMDLNINVTRINPNFVGLMQERTFKNIEGMSDDLAGELRSTLLEGWREGEGIVELRERIKAVWDNGNLTSARAEMIARTETVSIFNSSRVQAAKDSGVDAVKKWNAFHDSRLCKVCNALDKQVMPLGEDFYDRINDRYIDEMNVAHPRCRCRIEIVPV